jgi:hypothetical protein
MTVDKFSIIYHRGSACCHRLLARYKPSNQKRDEMKRAVLHGNTSYMIQSCHYSSRIGCLRIFQHTHAELRYSVISFPRRPYNVNCRTHNYMSPISTPRNYMSKHGVIIIQICAVNLTTTC